MAQKDRLKVMLAVDAMRCPGCWCAFRMHDDKKTIVHGPGSCKHAGRRFKYPTIELEEVTDVVDAKGR